MDFVLFLGGGNSRLHCPWGLVCRTDQALVESAVLGFRPGMDAPLRDDGGGGMAGLARRRLEGPEGGPGVVCGTVDAQCPVDAIVLWPASYWTRTDRDRPALADAGHNGGGVPTREAGGWGAAHPLPGMGEFRDHPEFHHLAIEPLIDSRDGDVHSLRLEHDLHFAE